LGGTGGAGGDASAISGAASAAEAKANAAAIAAQEQQQKQQQGQAQGQVANATGGDAKSVSGGNKISNDIKVSGDERNAPPVIAGNIPAVPTSCRLYLFGGGTNVNGAVSGTFPIGNDQTCLSVTALNVMIRANQIIPGTFAMRSLQIVACKIETMEDVPECIAINKK